MLFHDRCFINIVFVTNNNKMYLQKIFKLLTEMFEQTVLGCVDMPCCSAGGCTGFEETCCLHPGSDIED